MPPLLRLRAEQLSYGHAISASSCEQSALWFPSHPDLTNHTETILTEQQQCRPHRSAWPQWHHDTQTPAWPQVVVQTSNNHMASVMTGAMNMSSDPGLCRDTKPDKTLDNISDLATPRPRLAAWVSQIRDTPGTAQPSDTNKARGCSPDSRLLCALWWQHGPWTLTQT